MWRVANHCFHLVSRLKIRGAIPLLPYHALMAWKGALLLMASIIVYAFMRIKNASILINAPLLIDITYILHQNMCESVTHDYAVQYIIRLN